MNRNFILVTFFIVVFLAHAQNSTTVAGQTFETDNYFQITETLDAFWENNANKDRKGSGFKVYQRWKQLWKHYIHADGTLMTANEIHEEYLRTRLSMTTSSENQILSDQSNWIPLGPFTHTNRGSWSSGQGRVNVTTVDPNHPNIIYIGTPNGGLWKSVNHGQTWTNLTDFLPTIGVSGIAVDYNNSNIIYISTGDEDASDSFSSGVYKSTDGGLNWTLTGFPVPSFSLSGEIYIHPTNSNILWVVSSHGFYKSTNGGVTWQQKQQGNVKEMRLKPGNPDIMYIVVQGSSNVVVRRSTNGGESFSTIANYANAGRTVIDVTPANAEYVYVMVSNQDNSFKGLYRSTNGGNTFETRNTTTDIYESNQAWFDLALAVSDVDPDWIYTGCLNIWASFDGGLSFMKINEWSQPTQPSYTHADIHDLKFYNQKLYASTDGGIYISEDFGSSFSDKTINGLAIGQFYRIDVKPAAQNIISGGLQDNGGFLLSNDAWSTYHGADGMDNAVHPNLNLNYGLTQFGGGLYQINYTTNTSAGQFVAQRPNGQNGFWITPLEMSNQGTLYVGFNQLYRLQNNQWTLCGFTNFSSGISQIKVDPFNDKRLLIIEDEFAVYETDGTDNYTVSQLSFPVFDTYTNVAFNQDVPNTWYVTTSNAVFKTTDAGATWENITKDLPLGRKVDIVHQANSAHNTLYVAMNKAVYMTNDTMSNWVLFSANLPNTTIMDIEVNPVQNHVVIGTYGRGVWRTPVHPQSLSTPSETKNDVLHWFPNPAVDFISLNQNILEKGKIEVFNLSGQCVLHQTFDVWTNENKLQIGALQKGVYLVQLTTANHLITKKIVKN